MEAMWRATIQDMLEHMTPEEVVNSLQERYPDQPELLGLVEQLSPPRSDTSTTILGFCKKAGFEDYKEEEDPADWWKPKEERGLEHGVVPKSELQRLVRMIKEHEEAQTPEDIEQEIEELQKERHLTLRQIDQHRSGNPPKGYPLEELIGLLESVDETIAELRRRQQLKQEAPSAEEMEQMFKLERLKGLISKKAQMGYGFGYGNEGQSNFSVPNSEGEPGSGNPVDNTGDTTPSSSYTDHLLHRIKLKREEEEEQERRKKRKQLLEKLKEAQVEPGGLIKKKKAPGTPASTPEPPSDAAQQWEEVETEMQDTTKQTKNTTQETDRFKKKTEETVDTLKDQEDQTGETADETEEFGEATEQATEKVDKLRKSLEDLVS